ncbi:hypothetical protein H6M51_07710 [Rhizobium sp. AQ_MP]|uniref:hypothetical protein n=1 Tax=Rhizobium sp. AQ_MP TaxID=2761536 RepID=UPI0016398039|nr:hypothetical protein [Rhizobium sp. AQ_MP]MBC2772744.1 hypothetical protein [Rhizobium sp. AQ_MP]
MSAFRYQKQAPAADLDLLPPDRARRRIEPLSQRMARHEVVDAQFVTVRETSRPASPSAGASSAATLTPDPSLFFRSLVERIEARLQRLSDVGFSLLVAIAFVSIFSIAGQVFFGKAEHPELAAKPLDFTHVNLTPQDRNGMRVLLLNAIVENRTGRTVTLPKLRADLVLDGQVIASTYIEPPADSLEGGESRGIVTRLQHPGGKMPEVRLSFEEAGA